MGESEQSTLHAGNVHLQAERSCTLRSRGYTQGRFVVNRDRPEWTEQHVHLFQKLVHEAVTAG
jgi:hypothetical protein